VEEGGKFFLFLDGEEKEGKEKGRRGPFPSLCEGDDREKREKTKNETPVPAHRHELRKGGGKKKERSPDDLKTSEK